jgi:hypothetical protein
VSGQGVLARGPSTKRVRVITIVIISSMQMCPPTTESAPRRSAPSREHCGLEPGAPRQWCRRSRRRVSCVHTPDPADWQQRLAQALPVAVATGCQDLQALHRPISRPSLRRQQAGEAARAGARAVRKVRAHPGLVRRAVDRGSCHAPAPVHVRRDRGRCMTQATGALGRGVPRGVCRGPPPHWVPHACATALATHPAHAPGMQPVMQARPGGRRPCVKHHTRCGRLAASSPPLSAAPHSSAFSPRHRRCVWASDRVTSGAASGMGDAEVVVDASDTAAPQGSGATLAAIGCLLPAAPARHGSWRSMQASRGSWGAP